MKKISAFCLFTLLGCNSIYILAEMTSEEYLNLRKTTTLSTMQTAEPSAETTKEANTQASTTDQEQAAKTETANTPPLSKALKEIAPYPDVSKDQKRYAIFLEPKDNEHLYKVELVVGKTIEVDSCNQYMIGGLVDKKTLEGYGYDYFEVEQVGMPASTMMACPDEKKHQAFVKMTAQTITSYNSKLPIVVYAPKDVEVHYRIWSTSEESTLAEEAK